MDKEVAMAFGRMSEKINELGRRVDYLMSIKDEERKADIDYLAMMTDVEMSQEANDEITEV